MSSVEKPEDIEARVGKICDQMISEIQKYAEIEVVCNDNPQYVLSCLRVLGPQFCLQPTKPSVYGYSSRDKDIAEGSFEIKLSPSYVNSLIKDVREAQKTSIEKKDKYFYGTGIIERLHKEFDSARAKCEGLIQHLRLQAQDERSKVEEAIQLEQDIKSKYRRY